MADIKATYQHMLIIAVVAFVISIISLIVIRYTAGIFVWLTILIFLFCLFGLGYYSRKESDRLLAIAEEENFESSENNTYYNSTTLLYVSWFSYVLGGIAFLIVLFNLSTIALSIAIIKSAALYVASNFWIVTLPIFFAFFAVVYFISWTIGLAYLWSIGESTPRSMSPFAEIQWEKSTLYYILGHSFALLWNIAFINYLLVFVIACSCAIWYFNNKDSPNYFSRPIATSFYWAFRYHLGSIAFGAFILAIIWTIKIVLAYIAKEVQKLKKKGVESKVIDYAIKCMLVIVSCFERVVKFMSKLGFI